MTTSVIRAGGTGVAGVQTTGGDDGALALKVGPLDTTVEALSIASSGAVTFNDSGADVDFRVESDGDANMLFVDGGGNKVGIGTSSISGKLSVDGGVYAAAGSASGVAYGFYPAGTYGNTGMFSPAANTVAFATSGGEHMRIDSGGKVGIGMTPVASYGLLQVGSAVTSALGVTGLQAYVSGTNSALGQNGNLSIVTTNGQAANIGGSIGLGGKYVAAGTSALFAHIAGRKENGTDNNSAGYLQLATQTHGGVPTEKMRIDSGGNLLVGSTSTNPVASRANGSALGANGSLRSRTATGQNYFGLSVTSGVNLYFYTDNGSAFVTGGNISTNGSTTAFNTTSDYRSKNNIQPLTDALSRVALLRPVKWTWKEELGGTDPNGEGFVAHELAEILPMAVTGEKDAVDAEGKPEYQGVDTSFLVATLTAAIQEQQALIEALTTRITTLEG